MSQAIIYNQDSGTVAVLHPTQEALAMHGIDAIAQKDVPVGKPYKIILATAIPSDRSARDAWTVADADLTDGVGAASNEFPGAV